MLTATSMICPNAIPAHTPYRWLGDPPGSQPERITTFSLPFVLSPPCGERIMWIILPWPLHSDDVELSSCVFSGGVTPNLQPGCFPSAFCFLIPRAAASGWESRLLEVLLLPSQGLSMKWNHVSICPFIFFLVCGEVNQVPMNTYWSRLLVRLASSPSSFLPPRSCPLGWCACRVCAT